MQTGDILMEHEIKYISALEELWDLVSDVVEGGRLTEVDLPDDYRALVEKMQECERLRYTAP